MACLTVRDHGNQTPRVFTSNFPSRSLTPMTAKTIAFACLCLIGTAGLVAILVADEVRNVVTHGRWLQHDINRPKPPVVGPAGDYAATPVPKDAVILFDGTSLDAWRTPEGTPARWKVSDGFMEVGAGTGLIETRREILGMCNCGVEWASPNPPVGKGQDRGNSGIFLMGVFELQVIDSYQADTYADGQAGAIYGQYPPLANASRPPGEWQTYDIAFRRPRFDKAGKLLEPARFTLIHNGILIQNNEELWGGTNWLEPAPYDSQADRGPIELQDHGHKAAVLQIFWLPRATRATSRPRQNYPFRTECDFPCGRCARSPDRQIRHGPRQKCEACRDQSGRRSLTIQDGLPAQAARDAADLANGICFAVRGWAT